MGLFVLRLVFLVWSLDAQAGLGTWEWVGVGSEERSRGPGRGVWLREGIRPGFEATPGPTLLSLSCPYLPSPADRWVSSTLSRGVAHMGFQEGDLF